MTERARGDAGKTANFAGPEVFLSDRASGQNHLERSDPFPRTAPVGSFAPNVFGLYDVSGNLAEWTDTEAPPDESTPNIRHFYIRGGSWGTTTPLNCRLEHRRSSRMNATYPTLGFRIVLDLQPARPQPQEVMGFTSESEPE